MSAIKLHLEMAERDALERYADSIGVPAEDVVYAALNRLLLKDARDPEVIQDIRETKEWRKDNLPLWSDSSASVHAYEGNQPGDPVKGSRVIIEAVMSKNPPLHLPLGNMAIDRMRAKMTDLETDV